MRRMRGTNALLATVIMLSTLSCTTMAKVTNVREQPCQGTFATALSEILRAEGEPAEHAQRVIDNAAVLGAAFDYGPRPFTVQSRSGADYSFFVEKKGERCLLQLFSRRKGYMRYTNNLTYIQSQELPGCQCEE